MIKNILICPLDWGLGHATRCVPIINELVRLGFNVIIGADKNPLAFLKQEFPELETIVIPGYEVEYDEKGSSFKLFCESIRFYNFVKQEHQFLDSILKENNIDIIISDNRYGLWSNKIKSILITHQVFVKTPIGSQIAHKKIEKLISNFDECWVPDVEGNPNLSGDLSHLKPLKSPYRFIGPLSRFSLLPSERSRREDMEFDIIAIISGPEPQRTIFEEMVINQLENSDLKAVVIRGLPNASKKLESKREGLHVFNHLPSKTFLEYVQKSKIVVCRAGYSSIMDLITLKKKAILIPTPGQTEQEYLAKFHMEQGNFYTQQQGDFDLQKGFVEAEKFLTNQATLGSLSLGFLL